MAEERSHGRRELMLPYEHPYRHAIVATWRHQRELRVATALAVVLWLAGAVGVAVGAEELGFAAGVGAFLGPMAILLWFVAIVRVGWRMTRSWGRTTELGEVRAHRPQAGTEDPDMAHDEFAVTVEEDGHLVTWRFRPLLVSERAADGEMEIPGRPRYAVSPVDEMSFDARNTVRAAEQLVMAQAKAAEREAASAEVARAAIDADSAHAELAAEARSTAAALRRATGQRSRRD
jgi:hypothetical protein